MSNSVGRMTAIAVNVQVDQTSAATATRLVSRKRTVITAIVWADRTRRVRVSAAKLAGDEQGDLGLAGLECAT